MPTLEQVLAHIKSSKGSGQRRSDEVSSTVTSNSDPQDSTEDGTTQAVSEIAAPETSGIENSVHSLEALAQGAGEFARRENASAEQVDVTLVPIDRRLRLKHCDTLPVYSWTSATKTMGNTSITAACEGSAPWKVLIRAQVRVFQQIPVLVVPVNKGDVLMADMVAPRLMDVSALRRETLRSIENLVGYQFKRRLAAGREISSSILAAPKLVSKGDLVLISASNQVLDVQMKGIALAGGSVGKKINVRSNSSGRIIQTWIKGPGQVEVSP